MDNDKVTGNIGYSGHTSLFWFRLQYTKYSVTHILRYQMVFFVPKYVCPFGMEHGLCITAWSYAGKLNAPKGFVPIKKRLKNAGVLCGAVADDVHHGARRRLHDHEVPVKLAGDPCCRQHSPSRACASRHHHHVQLQLRRQQVEPSELYVAATFSASVFTMLLSTDHSLNITERVAPPRFLTEGRMRMTKSGLACVYCV